MMLYVRYPKERYCLKEVVEILKEEDNDNKSHVQDYTGLFRTTT